MNKILYVAVALSMIMICVPQAFAGDRVNYVVAKTGGYIPTGDLDDDNYDAGLTGEVAYGHYLTPNLVVEGGIGYFSSEADGYGFNLTDMLQTVNSCAILPCLTSWPRIEI